MKKTLHAVIAALLLGLAPLALAFHCPADMKKIDEALSMSPRLDMAQMDEVKKLRAEGEAMHKAGRHQEAVDALGKAMKMLGI